MKIITMILMILTTNIKAGELHVITHHGLKSFVKCQLGSLEFSDDDFVNQYRVSCKDRMIKLPSVSGLSGNNTSTVFYANMRFVCPLDSAFINSMNDFVLLFDCRDWL